MSLSTLCGAVCCLGVHVLSGIRSPFPTHGRCPQLFGLMELEPRCVSTSSHGRHQHEAPSEEKRHEYLGSLAAQDASKETGSQLRGQASLTPRTSWRSPPSSLARCPHKRASVILPSRAFRGRDAKHSVAQRGASQSGTKTQHANNPSQHGANSTNVYAYTRSVCACT